MAGASGVPSTRKVFEVFSCIPSVVGYNVRMDLEEYEEELDAQEVYVEYQDWELYQ